MELLKITVYKRNDKLSGGYEAAIDINSIISVIRFNQATGKSYFTLRTKLSNGLPGRLVNYEINETIDNLVSLTPDLISLTVTQRDGRQIIVGGVVHASEVMIFNVNKVCEGFFPLDSGTSFTYCEDGESNPVSYIVDESIDDVINEANSSPFPISADTGNFTVTDSNRALKLNVDGTDIYVPIYIYP